MKFYAATLIPLFALLPAAFGAFTFSIGGGDPPASWGVQNLDTNTVSITFDVSAATATGNTGADFHVNTAECGEDQDDYTIVAGLGELVSDDASDPLTVTFRNDIHITGTTYCISVSLMADGLATPVATQQFTYEVSATETGSATVVFNNPNLGDVINNDLGIDAAGGITGDVNPGLSAGSTTPGPFRFGDSITVELTSLSGFDAEIDGVTIDCGTAITGSNSGKTAFPNKASVAVTLPLACFADSDRTTRTVNLAVTWWVNNASVRRLRGLQNTADLPDSGSFEYGVDVEIVPMEDGSSASITKFYYCASAASAGMAAALFL
jgi:hypothetical protein